MSEDTKVLVRFRGADIKGGDETVIYGLDLELSDGDFVYITGRVGSGKTSIIRTITAENEPDGGEADVLGFNLMRMKRNQIPLLRRRLGVVYQDLRLLSDRNVEDNLDFVLRATGWKSESERKARIAETLQRVGMDTKSHRMPHQLSGGEQQRVSIARAILNSPALILADEPTGHLDRGSADGIMDLFRRINSEYGTAILMITHDESLIERYPGQVYVCENESCTLRK